MFSRRTAVLITATLVVALVTILTLYFKDQIVLSRMLEHTGREQWRDTSVFSCDLLSEVSFLYPEFSNWQIAPLESVSLDGNTSCVLGVTGDDTDLHSTTGEVVVERRFSGENEVVPVTAAKNQYGISYYSVIDPSSNTVNSHGYSREVIFYFDSTVYGIELIGLDQSIFPTDAFMEIVIATFRVER